MTDTQIKNFTDLLVWQKAHRLYLDALQDVKALPSTERGTRELADQLLRCTGSISANIAEGFASDGTAEYCRYLTIARKSCAETQNWYLKVGDAGHIRTAEARVMACEEISRMLYGLREKLRNKSGESREERPKFGKAANEARAEWSRLRSGNGNTRGEWRKV